MAEPLVEFFIAGTPVQQGSKGARVIDGGTRATTFDTNSTKLRPWRKAVKLAAQEVWRDQGQSPIGVPVQVTLTFVFEPVPSDPDRHWHAGTPDIDKLERALYDGLKDGGLLRDDCLVVKHLVAKRYAEHGEAAGARVSIDSLADHEKLASARRLHARTRR